MVILFKARLSTRIRNSLFIFGTRVARTAHETHTKSDQSFVQLIHLFLQMIGLCNVVGWVAKLPEQDLFYDQPLDEEDASRFWGLP